MDNENKRSGKKRTGRALIVTVIIAVLVAVAVVALVAVGALGGRDGGQVALTAEDNIFDVGVETITCKLDNPTTARIAYGDTFYLEIMGADGWETVAEKGDINFQLPLHTVWPLLSARIEFPVSVYSDMTETGRYRIVLPVKAGGEAMDLTWEFLVARIQENVEHIRAFVEDPEGTIQGMVSELRQAALVAYAEENGLLPGDEDVDAYMAELLQTHEEDDSLEREAIDRAYQEAGTTFEAYVEGMRPVYRANLAAKNVRDDFVAKYEKEHGWGSLLTEAQVEEVDAAWEAFVAERMAG